MRRERGLSPFTIAINGRTIQEFLAGIDRAGLSLRALTAAQANDLLASKVHEHGYARTTVRTWASALRPFFRFAEVRGWCRPGLADAIRTPRRYSGAGLPLGPSWDDVKRLLAAADGGRPIDVRDRALLMLLAVYGLRAGETAALRLGDFDWQREVLTVPHGKRGQPRTYPLCRPVGDAVLRYLREVRPRSERREVFLTLVAPFTPLTAGGLQSAVRTRLHALGLSLPHYGPHALRHACASHLLARGLSLEEIGDHLGHRNPDATRIYAKVDRPRGRPAAWSRPPCAPCCCSCTGLFCPTQALYGKVKQPLTINGVHLNERGNEEVAKIIDRGPRRRPAGGRQQHASLHWRPDQQARPPARRQAPFPRCREGHRQDDRSQGHEGQPRRSTSWRRKASSWLDNRTR